MKKVLFVCLALTFILTGCGKKSESLPQPSNPSPTAQMQTESPAAVPSNPPSEAPVENTPQSSNNSHADEAQLSDKLNDTAYAGRVTEITDTTITIIMDEKVSETFNLNERAKRDIEILEIEVDSKIVVNFDTVENREITGLEVEA